MQTSDHRQGGMPVRQEPAVRHGRGGGMPASHGYGCLRPLAAWMKGPVFTAGLLVFAGIASSLIAGHGPVLAQDAFEQLPIKQFHSYEPAARDQRQAMTASILEDLREGRQAWRKGRFVMARKAFERAARKGSLEAAWYLGHIYRLGRGAKRNDEKAFHYYRTVALAYDADEASRMRLMMTVDALVRVADYYRTGIGARKRRKDPRRAYRLYTIAAGHGHPAAFYGLGLLALKGEGMRRRPRRAIAWLVKAARLDHRLAAIQLGDIAARGLKGFVRRDPVAALSWYLIAARGLKEKDNPILFRRIAALSKTLTEQDRRRALALAKGFRTLNSVPTGAPLAQTMPASAQQNK